MTAPQNTEQVATDGTITCTGEPCSGDGRAILWALDLRARWPVVAHQVISKNDQRAVTVCGLTLTPPSGHGYVSGHPGELPLQEHAVHCRCDVAGGAW